MNATRRSGWRAAVAAELVKLRTLRSTTICLGLTVAAGAGVSWPNAVQARHLADKGGPDAADLDPAYLGLGGGFAAVFGLLVFGVLLVGSEYTVTATVGGGRQVTASLAAMPRRVAFWTAKLAAGVLVGAPAAAAAVVLGYLITQWQLGPHAARGIVPGLVRAMIGSVAFAVLFLLLAAAVAVAARSQVLPLTTLLPFFFIGGFRILTLVPGLSHVADLFPDVAGARMLAIGTELADGPSPAWGAAVSAVWAAGAVAAGALLLSRRDA